MNAGGKLADTELGRQASKLRTGLKDRVEDVREVWETSQNPLVSPSCEVVRWALLSW